jgi:hypothetical protein
LALVAQPAQCGLLLVFQVATRRSILAACLSALGQFVILAFVQAVDLAIEIGSQVLAGILEFGPARSKYPRRCEQEGRDYKGVCFPVLIHTSMPPWQIYLASGQAGFLVLIYEDWLRRARQLLCRETSGR